MNIKFANRKMNNLNSKQNKRIKIQHQNKRLEKLISREKNANMYLKQKDSVGK